MAGCGTCLAHCGTKHFRRLRYSAPGTAHCGADRMIVALISIVSSFGLHGAAPTSRPAQGIYNFENVGGIRRPGCSFIELEADV